LPEVGAFAMGTNLASIRKLEECGFVFLRDEPRLVRRHFRVTRRV